MAEGLGFKPTRREIRGGHGRAHHVHPGLLRRDDRWGPGVSDGGWGSVPIRKRGESGPWLDLVLGRSAAPRPFIIFLFSFSFLSYFLLIFGLKNFYKTSILNFGQLLNFVNPSLCCLNI
jgi:hypothetical protein